EVATGDVSAVLSSHVISDVEPVCDRLLVLGDGQVLLHETVAAAIAAHRVTSDSTAPDRGSLVARFPDRSGLLHRLIRTPVGAEEGREPSLEEVVLGYLASARRHRDAVAGATA